MGDQIVLRGAVDGHAAPRVTDAVAPRDDVEQRRDAAVRRLEGLARGVEGLEARGGLVAFRSLRRERSPERLIILIIQALGLGLEPP